MFFSAVVNAFKRFWLAGVVAACVACFSLNFRLGHLSLMNILAIAGVTLLAVFLVGVPLEYSKRKS